MFRTCIENVRKNAPLVHNITNYVTVNDVANILLACGASPIMADDSADVEDITSVCGGLNINIGTLNRNTVPSMLLAGKKANELGHKVLLDPVGAGAGTFRTETALKLLKEIRFDVVRGNISEIKTIALGTGKTRGVDASMDDVVTEDNLESSISLIEHLAADLGCIIAVTGAIDLVSDGKKCYVIRNGRPEMGKITGTGCQLSGLMTAFLTANPGNELEAAAASVAAMGLAGEIGWSHMESYEGNATYRSRIIDAIYHMDGEILEKGAKYTVHTKGETITKGDLLLYAVTDRSWLGGETLYSQVEKALKGGATIIQLREKNLDEKDFLAEAVEIKELCRRYQVPLIINDCVDIAMAMNADGVHVGQSDMEAGDVRGKLGPGKIIGVSAQTVEQALLAEKNGADYLGVGAVFHTGTKPDASAVSYETLKNICEAVRIPVVAIGGITENNAPLLAGSGICGIAVVSAIFAEKDIEKAARKLKMAAAQIVEGP